ncbi:hypothetical protein RJ639_038383 [Escallonia herrerae]|uniref:Transposase MuDR plant domain-containing protein n=1 Tax=Escallonia herrerae TaxID=1293975 RepID=A0AA88WK58_9ASTE|nr:hypothetical protein RJ639_038383 [Escallonia herrerae]
MKDVIQILLDDQDAYNMCTCNLQDSRIALVYVDHYGGVLDEVEEVLALPSSQTEQGVDNTQHHESVDGVHGVGANAHESVNEVYGVGANADASVDGVHGVGANADAYVDGVLGVGSNAHESVDGVHGVGANVDASVDGVHGVGANAHESVNGLHGVGANADASVDGVHGSGDRVAIGVENVEEDSDSGSNFHDTEITTDDEIDDAMLNENIDTSVESSELRDEDNGPSNYEVFNNFALDFTNAKHIEDPDFNVGAIFSSKSEFKEAVHMHGVKYGKVICFRRSEEKKIKVVCKECPWFVYASIRQNDTTWKIKFVQKEHTCGRSFDLHYVNSSWLAKKYVDKFMANPKWSHSSISDTVQTDYVAAAAAQGTSQTVNIEPSRVQRRKLPVIQSQPCFKNTYFLSTGVHVRVPENQSQPVKKSDRLRRCAELKNAAKEKFGRKNQAEVESVAVDKAVAAKEKAAKGKAAATEKDVKGKAAR